MPHSLSDVEQLLADLRGDVAPDQLYSIAVRCRTLGCHSVSRPSFEAAHHVILEVAHYLDRESLDEQTWLLEKSHLSEIAQHLEGALAGADRAAEILMVRYRRQEQITKH